MCGGGPRLFRLVRVRGERPRGARSAGLVSEHPSRHEDAQRDDWPQGLDTPDLRSSSDEPSYLACDKSAVVMCSAGSSTKFDLVACRDPFLAPDGGWR